MRKPDSFAPVQSDQFNFSKRKGKHRLHTIPSSTKAAFLQSRISSTLRYLDLRMRKQEDMNLNLEDPNLLLGCLIGISQKECSLNYNHTNIGRSIRPCKQIFFAPSLERRTCLILVDEEVQNGNKNKEMIDSYCRQLMLLWCYRVIDRLGFERDTVAASYVDRFLSIHQCDRATYKLT
jgi:hypothetical protein